MNEPVVVTGLGLVTPFGRDLDAIWTRLLAGESAVTAPRRYGSDRPPTRAVGEVPADLVTAR